MADISQILPAPPMTARDVASYLGIGLAVARRLMRQGKIRSYKAGGQWRTSPSEVVAYMAREMERKG